MIAAFFRHGSNALLFAAIVALAAAFASRLLAFNVWATVFGALIFFVSEYGTHRLLFHAPPSGHPALQRLQHRIHYDHHVDPGRLDLLFLPPWFVIPVSALYAGIYIAVTHSAATSAALMLGNLAAMLYYEWVHYVAHIPYVPITPFGRWMKKYHLLHHYLNERLWFGVTNPVLDVASRTYMRASDAERSTRTRVLYP